jgi:rhodanese-related sulfurtransferase
MEISEIPRISIAELKALIDSGAEIVIADNRPRNIYDEKHIKGAISLPWKPHIVDDEDFGLPLGKPVVTYCDCGPGESDSAEIALQLMDAGFSNVSTLALGWSEWVKEGYPAE